MRVLQLCCFTNLWPKEIEVVSFDLKLGNNIFDINQVYANAFDLIVSAPVCTQFTKANVRNWLNNPVSDLKLLQQCFNLSVNSGKPWFLENPPGRLLSLFPQLKQFRRCTYQCANLNKEYVVYSNLLLLYSANKRYGKHHLPRSKSEREQWSPDFVEFLYKQYLFSL